MARKKDGVSEDKAKRWLAENAEALEGVNAWVEKHGLPLARYRVIGNLGGKLDGPGDLDAMRRD